VFGLTHDVHGCDLMDPHLLADPACPPRVRDDSDPRTAICGPLHDDLQHAVALYGRAVRAGYDARCLH
jgi:hypothetical protein